MAKLYFYFSSLKLLGCRLSAARSAPVRRRDPGNKLRFFPPVLLPLNSAFFSPLDVFARRLVSSSSAPIDLYNSCGTHRSPSLVLQMLGTFCHPSLNIFAKVSSPLAAPKFVVTVPPTTFYPARLPPSTTPRATRSLHTSALLVPPQPVTTTPATEYSLAFSSHLRSNPSSDLSPSQQLIADLEETAASLQVQYDASERGVHSMIQYRVFPYTMSLADDAKKAKTELDEVMEKIAVVDRECAKLEALYQDECDRFSEAEEALKKARSILEGTDMEQAELLATVHELQAGQPVNGVWVERVSEPLDSTSPQCVAEQAEEYRGASSTAQNSSRGAKKAVKSWESRCNSQIALQRYSIPRAVQTAAKSDEEGHRSETDQGQGAKTAAPNPSMWVKHGPGLLGGANANGPNASTPQAPVTTSNGSEQRTQAPVGWNAHLAYTSDYLADRCAGVSSPWTLRSTLASLPLVQASTHN